MWARNGKELFYRTGRKLISVPVKPGADFVPRDCGRVTGKPETSGGLETRTGDLRLLAEYLPQ